MKIINREAWYKDNEDILLHGSVVTSDKASYHNVQKNRAPNSGLKTCIMEE
jgi:hypothetical protein